MIPVFANILVALDGSPAGQKALDRAVEMARAGETKLHAAYVVETGLFSSLPTDNTVEIMYNVLQKEGEAVLDKAKTDAAAHGITLSTHLKFGHAGSEVIALADKVKADLIIVGSHGKSQTDRLLIGSVSTFIVTHSRVSTMVVRS
ncbi:universal stress protein UspA-like protein [Methanoregula formicica SMSP]|uniref:Universal stress protein UspA-like protein n=1 Tax=Methanoregula formicica (strain DSM 22288 / NBRC 105244 / SMSP) TaxID=593750 RepID=L0HFR3_METFS|nr:universal stress protein UspA-like protein [Methanoregula formicica SMSP]